MREDEAGDVVAGQQLDQVRSRTRGALVLLLVACSGSGRPSLDWADYDPSVKQRIDEILNDPTGVDCRFLGDEFEDAKASGADDLMAWINWKADEVGCFPEGAGPFR